MIDSAFEAGLFETVVWTNLLCAMFDGGNDALWILITGKLDDPCLKHV